MEKKNKLDWKPYKELDNDIKLEQAHFGGKANSILAKFETLLQTEKIALELPVIVLSTLSRGQPDFIEKLYKLLCEYRQAQIDSWHAMNQLNSKKIANSWVSRDYDNEINKVYGPSGTL